MAYALTSHRSHAPGHIAMTSITCLEGAMARSGWEELFTASRGQWRIKRQGRRFIRDVVVELCSTFILMVCVCLVSARMDLDATSASPSNPNTSPPAISIHHASVTTGFIVMTLVWVAGSTSGELKFFCCYFSN